MRVMACVGIGAICLGLTGCSLFGKKSTAKPKAAGDRDAPQSALTSNPDRSPIQPTADRSPPSNVNGILAGRVIDPQGYPLARARIQVAESKDEQEQEAKPQYVTTDDNGYFIMQGVHAGVGYRLIAQGQEGSRMLVGRAVTIPPDSHILIKAFEQPQAPRTPPATGGNASTPSTNLPPQPSVGITAPARDAAGTPNIPPIRPEGIAQSPQNTNPPSVPASVPGFQPPSPDFSNRNPFSGSNPGSTRLPANASNLNPPWCVLVGLKLTDFSLADSDSRIWEFRRDHRGKLILLDFWKTTCVPCLNSMHHLVALHNVYGPGLEVIGVAYEDGGTFQDQVRKVRGVCSRKHIPYRILMGGGESCPVRTQFNVFALPTMFLLDEEGNILLRVEGANRMKEVELEIKRRLGTR